MYIEASPRKGVHTENKRERTQPANVIEDLLYSQIKDQSMDYRGAAYAANHNANPNTMALQCWLTVKSKICLEMHFFLRSLPLFTRH